MRLFLYAILLLFSFNLMAENNDFEILRNNYLQKNSNIPVNEKYAEELLNAQKADGTFPDVNYQNTESGLWDLRRHWQHLEVMAIAYNKGENLKGNEKLRQGIIRGIENWAEKGYRCSNWWYQEIGIPLLAIPVFMWVWDDIPKETYKKFRPIFDRSSIGWTALNRLHLASIEFYKGVIYRDEEMVKNGRQVLLDELVVVNRYKEGLQVDGSFHQHGTMMQFGNYGLAFLTTGAQWSAGMANTKYAFPSDKTEILQNFFLDGMRWVLYKGLFDFSACGRQITDNAQIAKFDSVKKAMLKNLALSENAKTEIQNWYNDGCVLEGNKVFYRSDYMVHRRKDLFFSVKMCSKRVLGSESTNNENMLGRHTAGGVSLFLQDGKEYLMCMPLWNWRRLPGITALQDNSSLYSPNYYYYNHAAFVGGVSDGEYGGAVLRLETENLSANKSYLCFDNYIYCRSSEIENKSSSEVNTTVDSRLLRTPVKVIFADNSSKVIDSGKFLFDNVIAIEHDKIGYRFPAEGGVSINVEIAQKDADWNKIHPAYPVRKVSGKMLTIWFEHTDKNPTAEWIYEATPNVSKNLKLSNKENMHVAYDTKSELGYAILFKAGEVTINGKDQWEFNSPVAVLLNNGQYTFSEPTQLQKELTGKRNNSTFKMKLPAYNYTGSSKKL